MTAPAPDVSGQPEMQARTLLRDCRHVLLAVIAAAGALTLSFYFAPSVFGILVVVTCALATVKLVAMTVGTIMGTIALTGIKVPEWLRRPLRRGD